LSGIFGAVIERAFASYELVVANRTLLDIAVRHMELAHKNPAIVAGYGSSLPVAMFVAVADSRNVSTFQCKGYNLLRSDDFLMPSFNHRYAPVEDSLWFGHEWPSLDYVDYIRPTPGREIGHLSE
jgi:hypothetical protein